MGTFQPSGSTGILLPVTAGMHFYKRQSVVLILAKNAILFFFIGKVNIFFLEVPVPVRY